LPRNGVNFRLPSMSMRECRAHDCQRTGRVQARATGRRGAGPEAPPPLGPQRPIQSSLSSTDFANESAQRGLARGFASGSLLVPIWLTFRSDVVRGSSLTALVRAGHREWRRADARSSASSSMTRRWRRAQRRLARARIERAGQLRNSLAAVGTPRVLAHSEMPSGKGVVTLSYSFGNVEVRVAQRQLLIDGRPAAVGGRAFDILLTLIERCDRAVPKDC